MDPPRWSFHTHSNFCDGEGTLSEVVESALRKSLTHLGFSSHAPLPFETDWNMSIDSLPQYQTEARRLREVYRGQIQLYLGAEIDYIPDDPVEAFQREHIFPAGFDYFVGSVHFLGRENPPASFDGAEEEFRRILNEAYAGVVRDMVADYYERIANVPIMPGVIIVGHFDVIKRWNFDNRYFDSTQAWYRELAESTLRSIADSGVAVELNTSGWRKGLGEPYPSVGLLKRCRELNIPITVNSDAHTPDQLDWGYGQSLELLESIHIEPVNPAELIAEKARSA